MADTAQHRRQILSTAVHCHILADTHPHTTPSANTRHLRRVPAPTQLLNISTRLLTQTGENVAIGGFIIAGSDPKTVLIRGLGPSLAAFVPNPLQDPTLELHQGSSVIASNDDWQDTPNVGQIPAGFEPADPRDSVIIATLSPGPYTVVQAAKDAAGGIGLLEIYDIDSAGDAMLANISTRGLVQTGDEAMIGGFILQGGTEESTVVVRAIGPSLTSFGIGNALADPTLELHDADGANPGQRQLERRACPGRRAHGDRVCAGRRPRISYGSDSSARGLYGDSRRQVAAPAWRWSRSTTCSNGGQLSSSSHDVELRTPGKANQLDWR